MTDEFVHMPVQNDVDLYVGPTKKFKTTVIRLCIQRNLDEDTTKAALIPFILVRGSSHYPTSRELAKGLENLYGARLSSDVTKIGERHLIEFYAEILNDRFLSDGSSILDQGFALLNDVVFNPVTEEGSFRKDYFDQETEMLRRRIQSLVNDKRRYAVTRCFEEMCCNEPFGRYKYGRVEQLEGLTQKDVFDHYKTLTESFPIMIFVSGDVEPAKIRDAVAGRISPKRTGNVALKPVSSDKPVDKVRTIVELHQMTQGIVVMGFRTRIRYPDDEYIPLLMYNGILGAFPHSKLFMNVRERASLAYYAYSRLEGSKGIMIASAGINPDRFDQTVDIINKQVQDMKDGNINDSELEATRVGLLNQLRSLGDSATQRIESQVVGIVNGRIRPPQETMELLQKVTKEDVVRVAQKVDLDTVYFLKGTEAGKESA